jgi:hypothetical protein
MTGLWQQPHIPRRRLDKGTSGVGVALHAAAARRLVAALRDGQAAALS